jgi:hypothetical protein
VCLFTHVAAGAVAGALAPNPLLAPVYALGSHVLLDVIPHFDLEKMRHEIALAVVAIAALAIGGAFSLKVVLGIVFGLLPDFENLLWRLGKIRDDQKVFPGHRKLVPHGMTTGPWSLSVQALFSVGAIAFLVGRGA